MNRSLREALRYRGCLICHVLDKDESDLMAQLQYKTVTEEKIRRDLVSSNGYCNFHFHQMARMTSPIVNAILTRDLIDKEIEAIEGESLDPTSRIDCPVCHDTAKREDFYLKELGVLLQNKAFRMEYEGSDGLCRGHLKRAMNDLNGSESSQFLLTTQLMHLKLLKVDLEIFISKVRSTSRDMGDEKNSWWIAIEKWVGKKGLREFESP